jgi:hypothetical protein
MSGAGDQQWGQLAEQQLKVLLLSTAMWLWKQNLGHYQPQQAPLAVPLLLLLVVCYPWLVAYAQA